VSRLFPFPNRASGFPLRSHDGTDTQRSHIHWYERLLPLGLNGTIDSKSVLDNNTYVTNPGVSMTHLINGMAGNIESHSVLDPGTSPLKITQVLDYTHYGFSKLQVVDANVLKWTFIRGDGKVGDSLTVLKKRPCTGL
jgi:hypothetical protein